MKNEDLSRVHRDYIESTSRPFREAKRYLSLLFLIFTLAIGQAWADATITLADVTPSSNWYEVTGVGRVTNKKGNAFSDGDYNCTGTGYKTGSSYFTVQTYTAITGLRILATSTSARTINGIAIGDAGASSAPSSFPSGASATGSIAKNTCDQIVTINFGTTVAANKYISIGLSGNANIFAVTFISATVTKHSVTYDLNGGSGYTPTQEDVAEGAKFTLHDGTTGISAPTNKEFDGWHDGTTKYAGGAEYTMGTSDVTLTAQWRDETVKYAVTYDLNGASGEAPISPSKAAGDVFSLAAAPSWAGHAFDGWLCSVDGLVKAAGASYTMTSAATTFTAQWHEVDCKIYSLTGAIGSAEVTAGTATVSADALVLGNSAARIKLTPATGETFKSGDVITISGAPGNTAKKFSAYVYAANGSTKLATLTVANAGDLPLLSGTLSGDADYVFLARIDGTTQNIYTCEVHRSCAEGTAAGLSYATASVDKGTGDAAFTNPLTNANSLFVAGYGSSDPTVATVDAAGQVTIVGAGSATITAYSATQTKAGTLYAAGTASYTLTVTAPPTYAVTYAANGGEGTMTDPNSPYLEGAEVTLLANAFTAPTSQEFDAWVVTETVSGDPVSVSAGKFTMPAVDVTVTATWRAVTEKYIVHYMDEDGTTPLGADEQVVVGQNPVGLAVTKPLFTLAAWQLSGSDIALDDASWALVAANAEVTLTARWAKAYASNADFEAYIIANKSEKDDADKAEAYVKSLNYALSTKTGTTFDANDETNNGAYAGLKIKHEATVLSWNVVAGKVVELKAGVMVANGSLAINGGTPATIDGGSTTSGNDNYKIHYFYSATEALYEFTTSNGSAEVIKAITMRDPFQVTFNANGGDPVASQYGHPAVTLPDASNGTKSLLGWFDAAEGGNKIGDVGESYTPAADIELFAQWEDVSTDARLASITFSSDAGTLSPAFDPEVVNYTYTMPYPTADVPTIVSATAVNANAQAPVIDAQAAAWGQTAIIRGVAQSGDSKAYNITMQIAPKDGVSIIKVATTGGTNKTVTGLYAGDGDVNLSSNTKMDNGKYIGFTLDGTTLQAGDRINVHTTEAATTGGSHIIFYDNMTSKTELYETGEIGGVGDNIFTINAAMVGQASAYVYRANNDAAHQWNGKVNFIEVTRAINPMLTAMTIDGRTVTINEAAKTATCTIPYESDLAALTIVPTIVWNAPAASGSIIVNDGSAWIIGDNTYKLTDKDGDATTYTITLSRDVLKHTVSFNTHGGSAVASEEVEHNAYLAAAPADPTKEDYIFQYWSLSDGGAEVDVTTVQINEDKEFHAVWASDGAIKLLDGSTVNHTNFITGVTADETVEFQGNTVNYAKFSGTVSGVNSVKDLTRVIAYNATTNKTKIRISAHNNSTSARNILVKGLVEGASAAVDLATIALGNKEDKVSDWIEFDNAANRTIYIMVSSSAGDVYFTQVKVIESGETPMKQAGEIGYSLNLNKGRAFGKADDDVVFEGLNIELIGDYTALNSGNLKMNSSSISFAVAAPVTLNVTTANSKTYYVANSASGTDNETAFAGVSEFNLTAGTWFINAGDADVQLTNIAFSAPKCEKPVFTSLADIELCEGDPFTAFNGSATVSDGGTISYQWYNEDDSEISGAIAASFTPSVDGKYYVIATNSLAGFADNFAKSDLVMVQHLANAVITAAPKNVRDDAGNEFTLTVAATGKNLSYEWFTCNEDGTGAVAVDPACTATSFTANVPAVTTYYKVVVSSDCGSAEALAKVEPWVDFSQVNVSENTNWDFTTCADAEIKLTDATTPKKGEEYLIANIRGVHYDDPAFNAQALIFAGEYIYRNVTGKPLGAIKLKFTTTVDGFVTVRFADNGNNNRCLRVTDSEGVEFSQSSASNSDIQEFTTFVHAGDIEIMGVKEDHTGENQYVRIFNLAFEKVDYSRAVNAGRYGTICLPKAGVMKEASLYEVAYKDASKIYFDEILSGEMVAGRPYIFLPNAGAKYIGVAYDDPSASPVAADSYNGLYGYYDLSYLTDADEREHPYNVQIGEYIISNNQYIKVNGNNSYIAQFRAYIKLDEIPGSAPAPAPGIRRIAMGYSGENTATGIDQITNEQLPMINKVIIDGQLFILRGEKMYDATGRLVK